MNPEDSKLNELSWSQKDMLCNSTCMKYLK